MSIERLFSYGAWADKYDGAVHRPPLRGVTLAMKEPIGAIGARLPRRVPAAGLHLARGSCHRDGQHGDRDSLASATAERDRLLLRSSRPPTCRLAS